MKLIFGILSLVFGLLSLIILGYLSWMFHSTIHKLAALGEGDFSPSIVGGLLPFALSIIMLLLGLFFGLLKIRTRNILGRKLCIAGVILSTSAFLVVIVPFFFLP